MTSNDGEFQFAVDVFEVGETDVAELGTTVAAWRIVGIDLGVEPAVARVWVKSLTTGMGSQSAPVRAASRAAWPLARTVVCWIQ